MEVARMAGKGADHGASDAVEAVAGALGPMTRKAGRGLKKLERKLVDARKVESKRLRQLAVAQEKKSRKEVAKRRLQASAAAADVAGLVARMGDRLREAAGSAADVVVDAVREVGSAAASAAAAISPVKPVPTRVHARRWFAISSTVADGLA